MIEQRGEVSLATLSLDPSADMPLYRQLEQAIRRMVLSGDLPPNSRLPATRHLSTDLGVSRLTVKNVYEQLVTEGFLHSRQGAGTFVADISTVDQFPEITRPFQAGSEIQQVLSERAGQIAASKSTTRLGGVSAFRPGVPALDKFPRAAWAAAHARAMRDGGDDLLGYGPPGGLEALKQTIATHVRDYRGIQCNPHHVIITSGAQQAFVLIALSLLEPGATVWCEDPGHIAARDAMRLLGGLVRSVPIDDDGFDLGYAMRKHRDAELLFVTPSHQHPLGVTMSLNRRLEILEYAQQRHCWIIEDDYDSEFRYADRALPALSALDQSGRVLYTGSFSKSLFPALRLGYLISPEALINAFASAQTLLSQHVSPLQQHTLARFMLDGSFNAHVRKMRNLYRQRRDLLIEQINTHLPEKFEIAPCRAGMHLVAWLKDRSANETDIASTIWNAGVECLPVSIYCDEQKLPPGIMLGFACARENEIEAGVKKIAEALNELAD